MCINIANSNNVRDWFYLIPGAILVDLAVVIMTKYPGENPYFQVNTLNTWYDRFGVLAVAADVLSALIGVMAARYIYTGLGLNSGFLFLVILVAFQLLHDIWFYLAIIKPLPTGHNEMIDVFKAYAKENGSKILTADALIVIATAVTGSLLKSAPAHITVATAFVSSYILSYILYTKRPYTKKQV
jgi:hypothetical protein